MLALKENPTIVPVNDEHGNNAKFVVRISPAWIHQMDKLIKFQGLPYCNRGELVRDAIYRHLLWLENKEGTEIPNSIMQQIAAMTDLLEDMKIQQKFENVIETLENRVKYHSGKGAHNESVKCVLRILGYIDGMPDTHWKDYFDKTIRERYKGLLASATKARLISK